MKKKPKRKAVAAASLTVHEQERNEARRILKRSLAREKEIRALSRQLARAMAHRDHELRQLRDHLMLRYPSRLVDAAIDAALEAAGTERS